jgi:hypothetical protein
MPTFTPPLADNGSLGDGAPPGSRSERFWSFYAAPPRGLNVMKYTDGTYETTDSYPYVIDGVGKVVAIAYTGGHSYTVTVAEAAALTAAGYGAYLT